MSTDGPREGVTAPVYREIAAVRAELSTLKRAFMISMGGLALGLCVALLTGCAKEHTVVIERVKVERIQGSPCMDVPPDVETFDWPYPSPLDGSITLSPPEIVELGHLLVALHTYALVQYSRCAIKAEEDEDDSAELEDTERQAVSRAPDCRVDTGGVRRCVVQSRAKPRQPTFGWWRP